MSLVTFLTLPGDSHVLLGVQYRQEVNLMAIDSTVYSAHSDVARLDVREITRRLNSALGATLIAALTGSKDPKISLRWSRQDGPVPKQEAVRKLQFAYAQWTLIAQAEGEQVARAWFIGSNPWLHDDTPLDAIREARFREVTAATTAMAHETPAG